MHPFNLLSENWIPVRREDGSAHRIAPWRITGPDPPAVDIDTPRPDFKGALLELLIGLVQTACPPENDKAWKRGFREPPSPETLKTAFAPLSPSFNLFGARPLFLQDLTLTEQEAKTPSPIAALLMDTPGENATRHNGDFFIKRDQPPEKLCPACAAAALATMQAYAPSGGVGYRVSIRGGGPLTTLVIGDTLWETVWSNVLPLSAKDVEPLPRDLGDSAGKVFPWAAPTHDSHKEGSEIHRAAAHFLHHYWGMPRRILLAPTEEPEVSACPVCGQSHNVFVRQFWTTNYGNNYGRGWRHPLTPYRDQGPGKEPLSLKGMSEGRGYNHWLGLVIGDGETEKFPVKPARAVYHYREAVYGDEAGSTGRLRAFGYDTDNMKVRNWCEGEYPIYPLDPEADATFLGEVTPLLKAADQVRRNLQTAVKEALFSDGGRDAKSDATLLADVATRFWADTDAAFYALVRETLGHLEDMEKLQTAYEGWRDTLLGAANAIFASVAEDGGAPPRKAKQIYAALNRMRAFNYVGSSKLLGIPTQKEAGK